VAIEAPWEPSRYERFAEHRARPFLDLLARIGARDPDLVVDLGCGNGPMTLLAADRWTGARVVGVDSSPQMLDRARQLDTGGRVQWVQADIAEWNICAAGAPDVVISNAALQWVPRHEELIPRWCEQLADGAWFALQVPGNGDAPSHQLLAAAVRDHPRRGELLPLLDRNRSAGPERYAELLSRHCSLVDVWETTYLQILDPAAASAHPVLDWVSGTSLRPLLAALDGAEREEFVADLAERYDRAYPRRAYGVPFPFRRVFAVGRRG
jgi:trans-aconitate 2-methyltransferase